MGYAVLQNARLAFPPAVAELKPLGLLPWVSTQLGVHYIALHYISCLIKNPDASVRSLRQLGRDRGTPHAHTHCATPHAMHYIFRTTCLCHKGDKDRTCLIKNPDASARSLRQLGRDRGSHTHIHTHTQCTPHAMNYIFRTTCLCHKGDKDRTCTTKNPDGSAQSLRQLGRDRGSPRPRAHTHSAHHTP